MFQQTVVSFCLAAFGLWHLRTAALPSPPSHSLLDISISELGELLDNGDITSHDLVELYLQRIEEVNEDLHAVIEVNPDAPATAEELDEERIKGHSRGPLHGIPILIKDNYATTDAMLTGAGSVCLARSQPAQEPTVVAKLREAGAVILGKTNLSEFSGVRGANVTEGWSPRGGQTSGAYVEHQSACGSSSGSGVAASLGLAAGTLGTDTAGSITCPAAFSNVVGIKPTVGLTSRFGVVPISARQDTTGPIAQSVGDAALILDAIAGYDADDNYTSAQPWDAPPSYASALNSSALQGKRLGVIWVDGELLNSNHYANIEQYKMVFDNALLDLKAAGAELVDVELATRQFSIDEYAYWILGNMSLYSGPDFNDAMGRYIDGLVPSPDVVHNTSELLRCLEAEPQELASEFSLSDWERIVQLNTTAGSLEAWEAYVSASEMSRGLFLGPITDHNLDALVMNPDIALSVAASPGLPIVTVPMGFLGDDAVTEWDPRGTVVRTAPGFPLGISFTADRWTEQELVGYAYAYEQISRRRVELEPRVKPTSDLDSIWKRKRGGAELISQ